MPRHCARPALRPLALFVLLVLLGLTCAVRAQHIDMVYITRNATLSRRMEQGVAIGFANHNDEVFFTHPFSPTVRIVSGAVITQNVAVSNRSTLAVGGGAIRAALFADGQSKVTISGGSVDEVEGSADSVITLRGGAVGRLSIADNATLHLYGTTLTVTPGGNGKRSGQQGAAYTVSGRLASGAVLHSTPLRVAGGAKYVLHNAPVAK